MKQSTTPEFDLSGSWRCNFVSHAQNKHRATIELKHRFSKLTGKMQIVKLNKETNVTETKMFLVHGLLYDGCVTLTAHNSTKHGTGVQAFLLRVTSNKKLVGGRMWYSVTNRIIEKQDVKWTRT
jgi:hypothetical protein